MENHNQSPSGVDGIMLPEELSELLEVLAMQVHEVWMKRRLDDGWCYGPLRDDKKRTHPCLVAYDRLPESEKEYDRLTASTTLKTILAAGFEIRKAEKT